MTTSEYWSKEKLWSAYGPDLRVIDYDPEIKIGKQLSHFRTEINSGVSFQPFRINDRRYWITMVERYIKRDEWDNKRLTEFYTIRNESVILKSGVSIEDLDKVMKKIYSLKLTKSQYPDLAFYL